MSKVWETTYVCANQYRYALDIYLTTVLSSSYVIITDRAIYAPGHGNNVVDGHNAMEKRYLKGKMELIIMLGSNDTTNIGMITSASKDAPIKFSDQCIHILNADREIAKERGVGTTSVRNILSSSDAGGITFWGGDLGFVGGDVLKSEISAHGLPQTYDRS